MSTPSELLNAMVETLKTELDGAAVEVRAHAGAFGMDGKENVTVKTPGVLVSCLDGTLDPRDYDPPAGDLVWAAFCLSPATAPFAAMDLAALVASVVDGQRWDGKAFNAASRVRMRNMHTNELARKGVSIWVVTWIQGVEFNTRVKAELIKSLRGIDFAFAMGGEDAAEDATPDAGATADLDGAEPPEEP